MRWDQFGTSPCGGKRHARRPSKLSGISLWPRTPCDCRAPQREGNQERRRDRSTQDTKRATPATCRAEKHQLPHVTEYWDIEDSILSGGVWNSLLKASRRCG